jgi:hypothetical protein
MEMGTAHIPTSNACVLCHGSGGEVKIVPAVLHPLEGWRRRLGCHGDVAHLPESMASTDEDDCVLCHKPTELPPPTYPHVADARLSCRTCHQSAEVGGLPIDHALRGDATCLLCHDLKVAPATGSGAPALPLPSGSGSDQAP